MKSGDNVSIPDVLIKAQGDPRAPEGRDADRRI
jgi:hypothetical protein